MNSTLVIAALLWRMSIPPNAATAAWMASATCPSSDVSKPTASVSAPVSAIESATTFARPS